ncbi:hypothetical protein CCP3SC15_420021 [Gammaproteobacteria bacterium]
MTASTLTTQALIENIGGFAYTDFKQNGVKMTTVQWATFCTTIIPQIEQWMYRYCNVPTFDPTSALNPITEYQNGSGATNFDSSVNEYDATDIVYYLRNLYLNDASLVVSEDIPAKAMPPTWAQRYPRPTGPLAEVDTLLILGMPTANGNLAITLNGSYTYNVAVTAGQTIAQVCAAIVAAGPKTDLAGIVWTPATTVPYVTFTAGTVGTRTVMQCNPNATGVSVYVVQTTRGTSTYTGDYEVDTINGLTKVIFNNNIPLRGIRNVKFTYKTGYPADSQQYAELQMIATRAVINFLNYKKMEQAAQVIQISGVEDLVQLWKGLNEKTLGSNGVLEDLDRYRRFPIEGSMFHNLVYSSSPLGGGI